MAAMLDEPPVQGWDIEWTYKNGLFADNGFGVTINKIASETRLPVGAFERTAEHHGAISACP